MIDTLKVYFIKLYIELQYHLYITGLSTLCNTSCRHHHRVMIISKTLVPKMSPWIVLNMALILGHLTIVVSL